MSPAPCQVPTVVEVSAKSRIQMQKMPIPSETINIGRAATGGLPCANGHNPLDEAEHANDDRSPSSQVAAGELGALALGHPLGPPPDERTVIEMTNL